ncbi:MAG: T9SS type A sorting domain-containing protein [Bacteroidetes bacterium]|nr:T9SS type A sorting domain-containing protein [Bacteroidota bacterium]
MNPNPTTNTISFKLPEGIIIQQARLQIIDGQGHVIMESIPMTEQNVLDISNLVNGLYLLRLFDGKNITTARFLKT